MSREHKQSRENEKKGALAGLLVLSKSSGATSIPIAGKQIRPKIHLKKVPKGRDPVYVYDLDIIGR